MTGKSEFHIQVWGRVQGVFFRATAKEAAESLSLVGYVKNMRDGSVEIVLQTTEDQTELLLDKILALNPHIQIEKKEIRHHPIEEIFTSFDVKRGR